MKLLLGLLVLLPSTVFANTLELPLTAEKLYRYLTENNITTKGGLLSHLPDQFNRRVVLVSDSQSRHKGTRELPRGDPLVAWCTFHHGPQRAWPGR